MKIYATFLWLSFLVTYPALVRANESYLLLAFSGSNDTLPVLPSHEAEISPNEDYRLVVRPQGNGLTHRVSPYLSCENVQNMLLCQQLTERKLIETMPSEIRRNGDTLGIQTGLHEELLFINQESNGRQTSTLYLTAYLNEIDHYLIKEEQFESCEIFWLVDRRSGERTMISSSPFFHPSTDGKVLVSGWDGLGWCDNYVSYYEFDFDTRSWSEEWRIRQQSKWGVIWAEWQSENSILLSIENPSSIPNIPNGLLIEMLQE